MLLTRTGHSRLLAFAAIIVVLHILLPMAPVSAHEVIVEQVVEISLEPHGDQLVVRLHVPLNLVGDANLPPLSGPLADRTMIEGPLRIVAADLAHNLDVQQADTVLPEPIATARVGPDGASIDVELRYATGPEMAGFSARLNAFRATGGPVRTNVRYRLPSGNDHTISVTGPPVRVMFDPDLGDVLQQFATLGLRALLDGGDHLLFLLCVLVPVRRARSAAALFASAALGQTIAIAISVLRPSMALESITALAMIAASAVVIAALQNVARAGLRWVVLLTLAFGALNGFAFGTTLAAAEQFAGAHRLVAVTAFTAVALSGELWLGALTWATRTWLDDRGAPERVVSILASAIVAHSAMHRVVDRGQILAQAATFGFERALVWITLGWACVMLLVVAANVVAGRAHRSHDRVSRPKATPAS